MRAKSTCKDDIT